MTTPQPWTVTIATCPSCRGARLHTVTAAAWECQICGSTGATPGESEAPDGADEDRSGWPAAWR